MEGTGKDLVLYGGKWGEYMMNNKGDKWHKPLGKQMRDVLFPIGNKLKNGESQEINITKQVEIENGESITGYNYLHGTDINAGGFQIKGTISKNSNGDIVYDLQYIWNDFINVNNDYWTDKVKNFGANIFWDPKDYKISIIWNDKSVIRANPTSQNVNTGWLSRY